MAILCASLFLRGLLMIKVLQTSPPVKPGKIEKWLSSPTLKASKRSLVSTNRVGLKRVNPDQDNVTAADVNDSEVATRQSPFRTPPSLSYCHDKVTMCFIV